MTVTATSLEDHPEWLQLQAVACVPGAEGDVRRAEASE